MTGFKISAPSSASLPSRNCSAIVIVEVGEALDQVVTVLLGLVEELGRDVLFAHVLAVVAVEVEGAHVDEIDDAVELVLGADRHLHVERVVRELLLQHLRDAPVVAAGAVHLVDEGEARNLVAAHLAVDRDRLRLHAGDRVEHQDGAVEHAQRALDFDGEVDVAGRVDDVDAVLAPLAERGGGLDRDALLTLQIHRVHLGADAVLAAHLVNRVDTAGVIKDALGERGLARVDVGRDADVAYFLDLHVRHCRFLRVWSAQYTQFLSECQPFGAGDQGRGNGIAVYQNDTGGNVEFVG